MILETKRLALREYTEHDAEFILALINDPDWHRNINDAGVRTIEAAKTWIADRLVATYRSKGFGLWAIERREDGALVGMCGLLDRATLPEIDVGYALAPAFRGQGYAREAVEGCLAFARDRLGKKRVLAIVNPDNVVSIKVLEKVGMRAQGDPYVDPDGRPTWLFAWDAD